MLPVSPDEAVDHIVRDLRHSEQRYDQCERGRVDERRHGEVDIIIPVAQARTMYAHLQELKVPSDSSPSPMAATAVKVLRRKWPGTCRKGL